MSSSEKKATVTTDVTLITRPESTYSAQAPLRPSTGPHQAPLPTTTISSAPATASAPPSRDHEDAEQRSLWKGATVYESDAEAGSCSYKQVRVVATNDDSKVWPGRRTLMQRYKRDKRRRQRCSPLKHLDRRTKVYVKLLLVVVLLGGAIGLGLGISKAVGGSIWKGDNRTAAINR